MQISPYLSFDGNCESALKFYEQCLDGKVEAMMTYKNSPMADEVPADWGDKIMHGELKIDDFTIMASDCMPEQYEAAKGTYIMVNVADPEKAEKAFSQLAEGGAVDMPMEETFWALKSGSLTDKFGIPWMVNCSKSEE